MVQFDLEQMAFKHNKDLWLDRVIYGSICKSIHTFRYHKRCHSGSGLLHSTRRCHTETHE